MVVRQWVGASEIPAQALPPQQRRSSEGSALRQGQRELVGGFRAYAGQVANDILAGVRKAVPEYAEVLAGPCGKVAAGGAQAVFVHGIDRLLAPDAPGEDWTPVMYGLGKIEFADGRSIDALREAFLVAGRVAGRRLWEYLRSHGVATEWPQQCADAMGVWFDELSAQCVKGYAAARAGSANAIEVRRRRLLELLTTGADHGTLATAARAARWDLPDTIAVVAMVAPAGPAPELPDAVLADLGAASPCLVLAAGADELSGLAELLPGWRLAIGPAVPVTEGQVSWRVARRALELADRGVLPAQPVIDCAEHRLMLTLFADERLVETLIETHLAPLDTLPDGLRERMLDTLHEWLASRGRAAEVATRLQVHVQTVRYRMNKLEDLLKVSFDDPQIRFELEVAVRAKRLLANHASRPLA